MGTELDSATRKADRALEHLETLYSRCQRFLDSEPHEVVVKFEAEAGCHVARVHIREMPPRPLGVVVGDVVHALRSALDHVAWQLARIGHTEKELLKRGTQSLIKFPIAYDSEAQFLGDPFLAFVPERAVAVLDRFQPYHRTDGPHDHWLARLNRFWNRDKHRTIHDSLAFVDLGGTTFQPGSIHVEDLEAGTDIEITLDPDNPTVKEGTEVARIRYRRGPDPVAQNVRVKRQPPAQIAFSEGREIALVFEDFLEMAGGVGEVIRAISVCFE